MKLKIAREGNKKLKEKLIDTAEKVKNESIKLKAVMEEKIKLQGKQHVR